MCAIDMCSDLTNCVVISVLAGLMDPKYGHRHCMGMPYEMRRERNFLEATEGMSDQEKTIAMILAIWRWADINGDLVLSALDGERWIKNTAVDSDGDYSEDSRHFTDYVEMCDQMGVGESPLLPDLLDSVSKPQKGPTRDQLLLWYSGIDKSELEKRFDPAQNAPGAPWTATMFARYQAGGDTALVRLQETPDEESEEVDEAVPVMWLTPSADDSSDDSHGDDNRGAGNSFRADSFVVKVSELTHVDKHEW